MSDYRRYRIPGGTYFFTVNLLERHPNDLLTRHIDILRQAVKETRKRWPFHIDTPRAQVPGWFCPTTCIVSGRCPKAIRIIPTAGGSLNKHFPRHCP